MKKKFIVEVEYNEIVEDVLHDLTVEMAIDDIMYGYVEAKAIENRFTVTVEEII